MIYNSSAECPLFPDSPGHCTALVAVRRTVASISLIGCLFVILVIVIFRKYQAFVQRLILYLSCAAFFLCIAYLMGELHPDGPLCDFQSWWMTYFDWSVLLWVSCITFSLFFSVIKMKSAEKLEWIYHVLCWGFPLLMSLLPFIGNHYGPAGAWCWVQDWPWRVGIWYGPLVIIIGMMFIVYVYLSVRLSRQVSTWEGTYDPDTERRKELLKEDIKPLRAYPFVYLAVSLFPLINRIQNAIDDQHPVFALVLLGSISSPLHGALNALVFGLDRETFSRLTPTQIKAAILGLFAHKALIQEYPETNIGESLERQETDPHEEDNLEH